MKIRDDRTEAQKKALRWLIVGTDPGMSGWGEAEGGTSYAAWACDDDNVEACEAWVMARRDMRRVRRVYAKDYRPRGKGHLHIYLWRRVDV